jgi:hypothetical protein
MPNTPHYHYAKKFMQLNLNNICRVLCPINCLCMHVLHIRKCFSWIPLKELPPGVLWSMNTSRILVLYLKCHFSSSFSRHFCLYRCAALNGLWFCPKQAWFHYFLLGIELIKVPFFFFFWFASLLVSCNRLHSLCVA